MNNYIKPLWLQEIEKEYKFLDVNKSVIKIKLGEFLEVGEEDNNSRSKKKIAFLRDGPFLPTITGAAASILGMMKALNNNGIPVILIKSVRGYDNLTYYQKLPFKVYFVNEQDFYNKKSLVIPKILKQEKVNIVQFDSAEAINIQSDLIFNDIKKVFEVHNVESDLLIQQGESKELIKYIKKQEVEAFKKSDALFFRSKENVNKFAEATQLEISKKVYLYKGSIDPTNYTFKSDRYLQDSDVLFLGHLNYKPNIIALEDIAKYIAPNILCNVLVVGDIKEQLISKFNKLKNIQFLGRVDNLDNAFNKAFVGIAPLSIGSGTRLKVLDYLAFGLPVICSSLAIEGLEVGIINHVLLENNFKKYPNLIKNVRYIFSKEKVEAARDFVLNHRSWDKTIKEVIKAYKIITQPL